MNHPAAAKCPHAAAGLATQPRSGSWVGLGKFAGAAKNLRDSVMDGINGAGASGLSIRDWMNQVIGVSMADNSAGVKHNKR